MVSNITNIIYEQYTVAVLSEEKMIETLMKIKTGIIMYSPYRKTSKIHLQYKMITIFVCYSKFVFETAISCQVYKIIHRE